MVCAPEIPGYLAQFVFAFKFAVAALQSVSPVYENRALPKPRSLQNGALASQKLPWGVRSVRTLDDFVPT